MRAVGTPQSLSTRGFISSLEDAQREAARCLGCADAPCENECPAGIPIPKVNLSILSGNIRRAAELVRTANPAAHICGACCPQEQFCQSVCIRAAIDTPLDIRGLHWFATDWEWKYHPRHPEIPDPGDRKVAIIGGGPTGIACAVGLGRRQIRAHIFEKGPEAGGLPAWAIPDDRLPSDITRRDIYNLTQYPITINVGQELTSLKELRKQYDAILVSVGALQESALEVTGLEGPGVYNGLDFLRIAKLTPDKVVIRGPVRIIGGGNVAVDCALVASALGANRISVIYRRSRAELPAWNREVNEAFDRGVDFLFQLQPLAVEREGDLIYRLICRRTTLGLPGEDGRREPIPLPSESISLETGMVIIAAGQKPQHFEEDLLDRDQQGNIIIDDAHQTNLPGVYAGGDTTGKCGTVVQAVQAGLNIAESITNDLKNMQ